MLLSFLSCPSFLPSFLLSSKDRYIDSVELVRLNSTTLVVRPDMPVGIRRFSVPFATVRALKAWFLAAFVSKMCQHVRLLTERTAASRAKVSLNLIGLPRPRLLNVPCKRQANHRPSQYACLRFVRRISENTISISNCDSETLSTVFKGLFVVGWTRVSTYTQSLNSVK